MFYIWEIFNGVVLRILVQPKITKRFFINLAEIHFLGDSTMVDNWAERFMSISNIQGQAQAYYLHPTVPSVYLLLFTFIYFTLLNFQQINFCLNSIILFKPELNRENPLNLSKRLLSQDLHNTIIFWNGFFNTLLSLPS